MFGRNRPLTKISSCTNIVDTDWLLNCKIWSTWNKKLKTCTVVLIISYWLGTPKRNSKLYSINMVSTNSHCYSHLHEKSTFWGENHVYIVVQFLLKLVQYFNKVFKNVLYFIVINPLKSEESLRIFLSIYLFETELFTGCLWLVLLYSKLPQIFQKGLFKTALIS